MYDNQDHPMPGRVSREAGPRKALGRGLASLMASVDAPGATINSTGYRTLPIERIAPNKEQPRKVFDAVALEELSSSIRTQGVLQPIVVRRHGDGYQIVAGERRWRAAMAAGLQQMPAVVKELTDVATLQIALIENIQRRDLDALEEAEAYHRLVVDHSFTHDDLAEALGKNRTTISNSLRLLKLPPAVLAMLRQGDLSAGHARALLGVTCATQVQRLAQDIVGRKMSVRETELRVKEFARVPSRRSGQRGAAASSEPAAEIASKGAGVADIEERLQRHLGTKVRVHCKKGSGHIAIDFHNFDALDDLLDRLLGH